MDFEKSLNILHGEIGDLVKDVDDCIDKYNTEKIKDYDLEALLSSLKKELKKFLKSSKEYFDFNKNIYDTVTYLNKCLKLEYNSIFDYNLYVKSIEDQKLAGQIKDFAVTELKHAKLLSDMIERFGGTPHFNPPESRSKRATSLESMLLEHMDGEKKAIDVLNKALKLIEDPKVRWLLGNIKMDELDHLKTLKKLLNNLHSPKSKVVVPSWYEDYDKGDKERPWTE